MADEKQQGKQQQIQVMTGDEMSRGRYSNNMVVSHTAEEFIIDWMLNSPSGTHLISRIVVSPGHLRRIIDALSDNLSRYEKNYGQVRLVEQKDRSFN